MTSPRTKTLLMLVAAAIAAGSVWGSLIVSSREAGRPKDVAKALLREAEELCRRTSRGWLSGEPSAALAARRAAGEEAIEIARELAAKIVDTGSRASLVESSEKLRRSCAAEDARVVARQQPATSGVDPAPFERLALTVSHLERLNRAASRGAEGYRQQQRASAAAGEAKRVSRIEGSATGTASSAVKEPGTRESSRPRPARETGRLDITIGAETRQHRHRVAHWSRVFKREAGALRTSRRDLQFQIENYSLAESSTACRAFGSVLARLDPDFRTGAPSRGLSLRVARMLGHYRRGVTECVTGRSAAAFAYLSEGDREWATVAKMAGRLFQPRPLRSQRDKRNSGPAPRRSKSAD